MKVLSFEPSFGCSSGAWSDTVVVEVAGEGDADGVVILK